MNDEFPGFIRFYYTITVFVRGSNGSNGRTGPAREKRVDIVLQLYQRVVGGIVVAIQAKHETHMYYVAFLLRLVC